MIIEILGKFYDNHSLSIVNRNLAIALHDKGIKVKVIALDTYDPKFNLDKDVIAVIKDLESVEYDNDADIQIRHTYPPIWAWPEKDNTKVVYIQPWEFYKAPFEWQYKFETFADAVIVPSNFCKQVFLRGGIKPSNIFTIENGYNTDIFNTLEPASEDKYNIDDGKFNFIYVGNAQWRKGLDILLNTWCKSFKKMDKARLIVKDNPAVYGQSNLLNEIIKLQYLTGCAEIVYIDDNLSDKEMASLYKRSSAVVHPYRAEGFGMHIQEAMACGCYPIVSDNGPTEDFVPRVTFSRVSTINKVIDINDPNIFATKSGDSMTQMGGHTFSSEPIAESLLQNMVGLYNSHNSKELYKKLTDETNLSSWCDVADKLIATLKIINERETKRG